MVLDFYMAISYAFALEMKYYIPSQGK